MQGQRIQIAQALLKIAHEVTAQDRRECAKALKISKVTICYYLNGKVTNNDKALRVLEFFKIQIAARQIEINAYARTNK